MFVNSGQNIATNITNTFRSNESKANRIRGLLIHKYEVSSYDVFALSNEEILQTFKIRFEVANIESRQKSEQNDGYDAGFGVETKAGFLAELTQDALDIIGFGSFFVAGGKGAVYAKVPGSTASINRAMKAALVQFNKNKKTITIKFKEGWTKAQKKAARKKVKAMNEHGNLEVVHKPARSGKHRSIFKKGGGKIKAGDDVDHIVELQVGGKDILSNLQSLDRSVNRSIGVSISLIARKLPSGTKIDKIVIK